MSSVLSEVVNYIRNNDNYSIIAHGGPDGDSIGSILALGLSLKEMGKRVRMYSSDPIPKSFAFMESINEINIGVPDNYSDTLLVLDCSDEKRLVAQDVNYKRFKTVINIDHHPFNTGFGDLNYCDDQRIATAELVYELIVSLGIKLTREIADPLYLGISTDSGWFGYENTSSKTHEIASKLLKSGVQQTTFKNNLEKTTLNHLKFLGYAFSKIEQFKDGTISLLLISERDLHTHGLGDFGEVEDLVNYLRNIEGTEVAILIKEEKGLYKFSMRSTSHFDVGDLCRHFGGGGHNKAAGFSTKESPNKLIEDIIEKIK